jgi:phosphoglycolate phosphatase
MTRLAIFDCDGTLVDSQANIHAAMISCFAAAGLVAPDRAAVRRIVGLSLPEAMRALLPDEGGARHLAEAELIALG